MKKMTWHLLVRVLSFVLFLPQVGFAVPDGHEFRIGVILPLSGPSASVGQSVRQGIELAFKQLPPDMQAHVRLIVEDDSWNPAHSVAAYKKLISSDKINALLVVGSSVGNALAPLVERVKIPMIAIGASDRNVTKGRTFVFSHWVTPEAEAQLLVAEMIRRKYSGIGIICMQQDGLLVICDAVRSAMRSAGIADKVLLDESFDRGELDFRSYISKVRAKKVDAIVTALLPGALSSFARQIRHSGFDVQLVGVELFEDASEVKASEGALVGSWYTNIDAPTSSFEESFQKEYGVSPGFGSANGYDSLSLLVQAWQQSKSIDGAALVKSLSSTKDYSGAAGTYAVTADNRFNLPAALKEVTDAGFRKIS